MKKEVLSLSAPKPVGAYSQAVAVGSWMFLSGQIPIDPQTEQLISGDIISQAKRVMENIRMVLKANNMDFSHVVKVGIFLVNMDDFSSVNEVYSGYFEKPFPARSCVAVRELPKGVDIEIEVIAFGK